MEKKYDYKNTPVLALRGIVFFPSSIIHFDMERKSSKKAVKAAQEKNNLIFLTSQKDLKTEDPKGSDLYKVGVLVEIMQVLTITPEVSRVIALPKGRSKVGEFLAGDDYISANVNFYPNTTIRTKANIDESVALMRLSKKLIEEYDKLNIFLPKDIFLNIITIDDPIYFAEYVGGSIMLEVQAKQEILEETSPLKRLRLLVKTLKDELEISKIENEISKEMRKNIDENQRDYYLREQMRVLSEQLGEEEFSEIDQYREKIEKLKTTKKVKEKLNSDINRLVKMPSSAQEAAVIRQYLDTILTLPFGVYTKDKIDINKIEALLNRDHYGLDKVKERILEMLAVRKLAPNIKGQIICLVGPPGVGKTSIARSIADSIGRKYSRISLGGVRDEADIRGHRKTYVGAMAGRIISAVTASGSANPLILLDEVDKMGNDFRGDPASAMLEVLDPEQNKEFVDHYLEIPFDLSQILFITTANTLSTVPRALLDRMEIIEISSYTREEKYNIAKKHLIKKQITEHGLNNTNFTITDGAVYMLIDNYTREAGVRNLERIIAKLCRKGAKILVSGSDKKVTVNTKNIAGFLGNTKFKPEKIKDEVLIGTVNGLAWTSVGGEVMPIEVNIMKGTGKIELTGSLGKVIKESAKIAISYVRSKADEFGIDPEFYKECDIHIHAPEGAVPKDGPSAGVTMVTALVSALGGYPVQQDVTMTGEITLRGKVLPIGGLKEKSMAAYRAGASMVLIPKENLGDLQEIDAIVKSSTTFIPIENVNEVLKIALKDFMINKQRINPVIAGKTAEIQTHRI